MATDELNKKVEFILLLARSLQKCGAAAHHLERALSKAGKGLGIQNQYLALPTGLLASFQLAEAQRSVVIRFQPGPIDLAKLARIDETADRVLDNELTLEDGFREIEAINHMGDDYGAAFEVMAYGMTSAGFVTALRGSLGDLLLAGALGMIIGAVDVMGRKVEGFDQIFGALAAALATVVAMLMAGYFPGFSPDLVILASIVVLLPGLTLIISFVEMATKNLVAGTARLAGATGDLLKLVFTIAIGKKILLESGLSQLPPGLPLPAWSEAVGGVALATGFIILFRVRKKHFLSAFIVSILAYALSRIGAQKLGVELSFFVTGAAVAIVSNTLARILRRPGLITLLPGIILIVPGSIGFRGFSAMFQNNVMDTVQISFNVLIIAVSLVAGLHFGNAVLPPRRSL